MKAANLSLALVVLASLLFGSLTVCGQADAENLRPRDRNSGHDHDDARNGVRNGQLVPLGEVIRTVQARYPGQLLDASLHELVPGQPVYRVLILTKDGRRLAVWVDARTGQILRVEG